MGLTSSLFSGVSGLRNHQKMMDVIGNNISNVNTVGFKSSRILFSETLNQAVRFGSDPEGDRGGMNSYQIGLGSQISSIDRVWAQGSFERTGIVTDLALEGEGMFVLKRDDKILYTRAGALTFDANGNLVSPMNGLILQGKSAIDANGEIGEIQSGNQLTNINISPSLKIPAIATTSTSWGGNLKSDSTLTRSELFVQNGNFNTGDIVGTTYTDTNTIYDEDGTAYTFESTYTKTAADTFDFTYDILDPSGASIFAAPPAAIEAVFDPLTGAMTTFNGVPAANFAFNVGAGTIPAGSTLSFEYDPTDIQLTNSATAFSSTVDSARKPTSVSGSLTIYDSLGLAHTMTIKFTKLSNNTWKWAADVPTAGTSLSNNIGVITFNPNGSIATPSVSPIVNFNPGGGATTQNITIDFGGGFKGITQTSSSSALSDLSQNGSASASLENVTVDQWGKVLGIFSNGTSKTLAQIMIASFTNYSGLLSSGENVFEAGPNSGIPLITEPGNGVSTYVRSGVLEQSNVDLAEEFTRMIVAQRGYQASARVITTSDNLLQEVTNLIR